jgi:magnesium chelatase family protein
LLVSGCRVAVAKHLLDVVAHAAGSSPLEFASGAAPPIGAAQHPDLYDVHGQVQAKRALEIAAAGEHSLLMIGPPGSGKSMLAQRLPGLLPPMSEGEALEVASVRSIAGLALKAAHWRVRPFRSPHHTSSAVALVGGGSGPRPGEVSLAHHGVLFLDELPEFARSVLEVLREPLENGSVTISRAARQAEFPAALRVDVAAPSSKCSVIEVACRVRSSIGWICTSKCRACRRSCCRRRRERNRVRGSRCAWLARASSRSRGRGR